MWNMDIVLFLYFEIFFFIWWFERSSFCTSCQSFVIFFWIFLVPLFLLLSIDSDGETYNIKENINKYIKNIL